MKYHSPLISRITAFRLKMIDLARVYNEVINYAHYECSTDFCINDTNTERVHQNRLHHLTKQQTESNRLIIYYLVIKTNEY